MCGSEGRLGRKSCASCAVKTVRGLTPPTTGAKHRLLSPLSPTASTCDVNPLEKELTMYNISLLNFKITHVCCWEGLLFFFLASKIPSTGRLIVMNARTPLPAPSVWKSRGLPLRSKGVGTWAPGHLGPGSAPGQHGAHRPLPAPTLLTSFCLLSRKSPVKHTETCYPFPLQREIIHGGDSAPTPPAAWFMGTRG